ncbi:hypothetical protein [Algiphilus aromaticivorans]|uniref:hypothetical protein n=1 Tax=Algiphilus aromaticivorans TaxID=382454 RepID=UPI000694B813|nr:hypothetical protein [Algiphilus aromaticivorans]
MKAAAPVETEGFDWRNPDYGAVYAERVARLKSIQDDPEALPAIKAYYAEHPADFIHDWGMTSDPRNAEVGLPVVVPFLLFAKQREFIDWLYDRWRGRENGLVEKSRDMGVTWLCAGFAAWMWLFHPATVFGFGSRKEEYVDKIGDPKSIFWKLRQFIELLPPEFRPVGFDRRKHAPYMRLINPENDAAIVGEAGDNIGRGNRAAMYIVDEKAFIQNQESIEAALSQTSNCNIDVSTPNTAGDAFARKRHSGRVPVFTFHWSDDPRKDDAWYAKQKENLDAAIVAREIDINYTASIADAYIDGEAVSDAQRNGPAHVDAVGGWILGVDAAHFGDDEAVITPRKGRLTKEQVPRKGLSGPGLASVVEGLCADLESGGEHIAEIVIELDGPGVSAFDQLRLGRWANVTRGVHTGQRLKDNRNWNLRALMWRRANDYLNEPPVSLPRDGELAAQLCAMRYRHKDGLLLMQDKTEYKKDNGRSPDRADSFVLTFAGAAAGGDVGAPNPRRSAGGWV